MLDWIVQIPPASALDERLEQRRPDAAAARFLGDVHGVLDDARVALPRGHRRDGGPADDRSGLHRDQTVVAQPSRVELRPGRRLGLEGGCAGRDALPVDALHRGPVGGHERPDLGHAPA
jgi:hypothetical protein